MLLEMLFPRLYIPELFPPLYAVVTVQESPRRHRKAHQAVQANPFQKLIIWATRQTKVWYDVLVVKTKVEDVLTDNYGEVYDGKLGGYSRDHAGHYTGSNGVWLQ